MTDAMKIAKKIQEDTQLLLDNLIDHEEHYARNSASWKEAQDLGLDSEVDAILQADALLQADAGG